MNFYQQPFGYVPQAPMGYVGQPVYPQGYPQLMPQSPYEFGPQPGALDGGRLPIEQSYIENILRLNLGKVATIYMNFENSQWGSKIFKGFVMAAGRDHIILHDLQTETRYVLLMVYLTYITFDEELEYTYPYRNKSEKALKG